MSLLKVSCNSCFSNGFFSTFTRLSLKDLLWAAALVLHGLDYHSSRTSLAPCCLKASPFKAGQLARAPGRPHSQMAVSLRRRRKKKTKTLPITINQSRTLSNAFPVMSFYVVYVFQNTLPGIILSAPLLAPRTFKRHWKQLQHTSVADNAPSAQTNYSDIPVGIQK